MKKCLLLTCAALAVALSTALTVYAEAYKPVNLYVDGVCEEKAGVLIESKTYVPLRLLSEKMGCRVDWQADTKTATVAYSGRSIAFTNGDGNSIILNSKMYIPIRKATESLNMAIEWDAATKSVRVELPKANTEVDDNISFENRLLYMLPKEKNIMVSPLSLKYALAMAANGATDATKAEIVRVLNIEGGLPAFNDRVKAYTEQIKEYNDGKNSALEIANSVWINESMTDSNNPKLNSTFQGIITDKYKGKTAVVNNSNAVNEINSWCSEKTNHKINKLVEDSKFKMLLANAVYFKGKWAHPFESYLTHEDSFTGYDGKVGKVEYLNGTANYGYYRDKDIQVVCLPYTNNCAMYVAMPENKDMVYSIEDYTKRCQSRRLNLSMPKFKIENTLKLKDVLESIGIKNAFIPDGKQYPGILEGSEELVLSEVLHNTYIAVDEEGTEAAAVTGLAMVGTTALQEEPLVVKINRPFNFYIVDKQEGFVIFEGRYLYAG